MKTIAFDLLLLLFFIPVSCKVFRHEKGRYITLSEVIPDARIVSETEGIVEY